MDLRRFFGQEHAHYRRSANRTQEEVAAAIGFSLRTVQSVEQGVRTPQDDFAVAGDRLFGLDGTLRRLAARARDDGSPFGDFVQHEARARKIKTYVPMMVPGLVQTPAYAEAVMVAADPSMDIAEGLRIRLARQEILCRERPPRLCVVLDESVLYRPIGGPDVHREQLTRLADPPRNVIMQVLPLDVGAHPGMDGQLELLEFDDESPVVNVSGWGFSAIMDGPDVAKRAQDAYDLLVAQALSPAVSAEMLAEVLEGL